jgi:lipopolysaccharide/colanic/teichoic acid biosynthesis glycosyltransferase
MKRKNIILFLLDILSVTGSYFFILYLKSKVNIFSDKRYINSYYVFVAIWLIISLIYSKYHGSKPDGPKVMNHNIFTANFVILAVLIIVMYATRRDDYSRLVVFGTIGLTSVLEFILWNLMYKIKTNTPELEDYLESYIENVPGLPANPAKHPKHSRKNIVYYLESLKSTIISSKGERVYEFLASQVDPCNPKTLVVSTTSRFNIDNQPDDFFENIINLRKVNDIRYINKFFEGVNNKLTEEGLFIGCAETKNQRKIRILLKYPRGLNYIIYSIDFIIKRIFPKFAFTKKIYFFLTRGENRVMSRAEILGRLYSCGFEVLVEEFISQNYYWVARKKKIPCFDMNPTYGVLVHLTRLGKNGKLIKVYKFRTMHPYSEYLQDYIYSKHDLAEGGKFKNDFRVSAIGRFLRTFWLDELPMFINFFKGELKLVGVRPISKHYFSLYTKELQEKRIKYKPGLVPPFYVDMPKTLDEIMASEMKYLEAYDKRPFVTDCTYFWKAFVNIVFRKARSK